MIDSGKTKQGHGWFATGADKLGPEENEISVETDRMLDYVSLTESDLTAMLEAIRNV